MHRLVEDVKAVVHLGPMDESRLSKIEDILRQSVSRLQGEALCTQPLKPGRYLCYRDPESGFVVMVLVWGPGDGTPIHDHGTWGVEVVLRSALKVTLYNQCEVDPQPEASQILGPGSIIHHLPPQRDVHKVEHGGGPDVALSLHIYGQAMNKNRSFVPGRGFQTCALACEPLGLDIAAKIVEKRA